MPTRNYWLDLFTGSTWQVFREKGGSVSGFRESRWNTVQKIKRGDYLLCYLTGVSRFIGILEVTSEPYRDTTPFWNEDVFPSRVHVKVIAELTPETAVPVLSLRGNLSIFENLESQSAWTGHVRGSPSLWKRKDGEIIVNAIMDAIRNPVVRPVDPKKLGYRPKALKTSIGSVTVPGAESDEESVAKAGSQPTDHTEIQGLLLRLGADMGFDVWVARNDRSRSANGKKLSDLKGIRAELPRQFDEATSRTIELIDVLWLKGNAIVAAFEIESTTSIYSGLLRMSDLMAMQPNINIPLYLVAPDERREKVLTEVNRPTFSRLHPRLAEICRFISFSTLRKQIEKVSSVVQYLKPEFLEELSESCELEEA